jgi:hypothetical protein
MPRRRTPPTPPPKNTWGKGPWQHEPDTALWVHAGLHCFIYRHTLVTGSLNGYVAVSPEHPWWGKEYNECVATPRCDPEPETDYEALVKLEGFPMPPQGSRLRSLMSEPRWSCSHRIEALLEVHGGVTYAGPMTAIADEQENQFDWGFGFDTGHAGDVTPAMDATIRQIYLAKPGGAAEWAEHERILKGGPFGATYKTFAYVKRETQLLAEQLAIVKGAGWQSLEEAAGRPDDDDAASPDAEVRMVRTHG